MTRSPSFTPLTPGPTASTTPATSPDGENGSSGFAWYLPRVISVSKKLSAAALTAISASPGPGCGAAMSSMTRPSGPVEALAKRSFHVKPPGRQRSNVQLPFAPRAAAPGKAGANGRAEPPMTDMPAANWPPDRPRLFRHRRRAHVESA